MDVFWTSQLVTTKTASSDAFDSNRLMRRPASTPDRASQLSPVGAGARVLRVLVVDGKQDSATGLVRRVCRWGHTAQVALDGLAALRVAAAQNPDVVLLNMDTPFMDGCQVARHLRLDFPRNECLIIAIAERADDVRRQQCIEAGIDLVLTKPVDPSVVETLLLLECELVNRRRARRAGNKLNGLS